MNHNCPEMIRLRKMLEDSEIPYHDGSDAFTGFICPGYMTMDRVEIYKPKTMHRLVSIVHGYRSRGGFEKTDKSDDAGLLEIKVTDRQSEGFKTAEDAYQVIVELRNHSIKE